VIRYGTTLPKRIAGNSKISPQNPIIHRAIPILQLAQAFLHFWIFADRLTRRRAARGPRGDVTSVVGIQVFDSTGKYLGRLRGARNLAFGGPDKRTLYLTAADGFFRVKMLSQGPERLGK
jgi:hypothetical protein